MFKKQEIAYRHYVHIEIHKGTLKKSKRKVPKGIGAKLTFTGIVRPDETGQPISALRYDMIRPLADKQLQDLATKIAGKYKLEFVVVQHSIGFVPINRPSFRLTISAIHRKNLFAAMQEFINEMKRFVAISKHPMYPRYISSMD